MVSLTNSEGIQAHLVPLPHLKAKGKLLAKSSLLLLLLLLTASSEASDPASAVSLSTRISGGPPDCLL